MSLAAPPQQQPPQHHQHKRDELGQPDGLRVTPYNRASGLLVALLVMVGLAALFLLILWLSTGASGPEPTAPVKPYKLGGGTPDGLPNESLKGDIREEVSQETDLEEPEIQTTMEMITAAIANKVADLDIPITKSDAESGGQAGGQDGTGDKAGLGDGPGAGDGAPIWHIKGENLTLNDYARLLDINEIELAAIGDGKIMYAKDFTKGAPKTRTATSTKDEERQYLSNQSGNLRNYDLQLLQRAGIPTRNKLIVLFMEDGFLVKLQSKELGFNDKKPNEIRKTTFSIIKAGNDFEFKVIDQDIR